MFDTLFSKILSKQTRFWFGNGNRKQWESPTSKKDEIFHKRPRLLLKTDR